MRNKSILCVAVSINALLSNLLAVIANWFDVKMLGWVAVVCLLLISISVAFVRSDKRGLDYAIEKTLVVCVVSIFLSVVLFETLTRQCIRWGLQGSGTPSETRLGTPVRGSGGTSMYGGRIQKW